MALTVNKSNEKVIDGFKLVTGVAEVKVLAINPTKEELEKLYGKELTKDPSYVGVSPTTGQDYVRIEIHTEIVNHPKFAGIQSRISYFIENNKSVSRNGKTQFINKYGRQGWAESKEDLKNVQYYLDEGTREAYVGEETFTNTFLRNIANVAANGECRLDSWDKMFKGDFSELKELSKAVGSNTVRALHGVRKTDDGKLYQEIYNKCFERPYINGNAKFLVALSDPYGQFGSKSNPIDWQNDLTLKEYEIKTVAMPTPDNEDEPKETSMF